MLKIHVNYEMNWNREKKNTSIHDGRKLENYTPLLSSKYDNFFVQCGKSTVIGIFKYSGI